jgi:hypothetical protein
MPQGGQRLTSYLLSVRTSAAAALPLQRHHVLTHWWITLPCHEGACEGQLNCLLLKYATLAN